MRPGSGDRRYSIVITGNELDVLKECCLDLPESYGLDGRIAAYHGIRPIGFYRWDLDCLVDTLSLELDPRTLEPRDGSREPKPDLAALQSLYERLNALREEAYAKTSSSR